MKKKAALIVLVLVTTFVFLAVKFNTGAKTVEEAITPQVPTPLSIIYQEKTDKGTIVFSYTSDFKGLYTAFVKKNLFSYKTVYDGVQGDIKLVANKFGLSYSYFPNIKGTSLPIYFGMIGNSHISQVKIVEKKRNIERQAKIINTNGTRFWLVYMDKLKGSDFDIIGLSADGKELTKLNGDISPYYAEQKPFISSY